jgi:predicted transcriptional regulator
MKLLLYCTKAKPYLTRNDLPNEKGEFYKHWQLGGELDKKHLYGDTPILNGKIVAECDYEVEEITTFEDYTGCEIYYETNKVDYERLLQKSCLDNQQLDDYLYGDKGYAIHIKNLNIFDKPKELEYFNSYKDDNYNVIEKAPQYMMYAYYITKSYADTIWEKPFVRYTYDKYVLISIKRQWLCKILNGGKTIEVRKKVLKEMLSNDNKG